MAELKDIVEQIQQRNLNKALELCELNQNNKNKHIILNFMGVIHLLKNNLDLAETNFLSSAKIDEKFEDPIKNLYSICLRKNNLKDLLFYAKKLIKSEIKFPIFSDSDDIRSILEYHALGQIWIFEEREKDINETLSNIIKYSVDILIVDLNEKPNLSSKKLLGNKYDFKYFEISRFYGGSLFFKITSDKILSLLFAAFNWIEKGCS